MIKALKYIFAVIAILSGLFAIINIIKAPELILGIISLTIGITAIIWVLRARSVLSPKSSLRSYTTHFLLTLLFVLLYSIWSTLHKLLFWSDSSPYLIYPEYLFITLAYIVFLFSAYKILYLGKEFGFQSEAREIEKIIKEKRKIRLNAKKSN